MKEHEAYQENRGLEALLRSLTEYVVAINPNYQIIMANDLFQRDFDGQPHGFCYQRWKKRTDRCESCLAEETFRDGRAHAREDTLVMKNGRKAQMIIQSTPVKDHRGKTVYVVETATDVTEKKRLRDELNRIPGGLERVVAERMRSLQESENRYRTIFERSRDTVLVTDDKGKMVEINEAGVEIFGFRTKEEISQLEPVTQSFFEDEEDLLRFQKEIARYGYVTEFETRLRRNKDSAFDARTTGNVLLDPAGQIAGYAIIIRDISEEKKARDRNNALGMQVERRNLRLATLSAISTTVCSSLEIEAVLKSTVDTIVELLEPVSMRIYLYDKKTKTLNLTAHRGLSPDFIGRSTTKSRKAGEGLLGKTVIDNEIKVVDNFKRSKDPYVSFLLEEGLKSSVYIPLLFKGEPVAVMVVSSHSDFKFSTDYVSFLTAIGNQIGVAIENANLYENLKKAYQDLKEAQEQVIASEKMASLGKLSATIAHEINNPLAAVLTYIRLLLKLLRRDRFTPDRLKDIVRYLGVMESETARCGEIVKNLLAFSRQSKMTIAAHSMGDIIDKTLLLVAHDLEMKGIQLVKKIAPDLPGVLCDFKQIQQTFLNLFVNASEAMTAGGTLTVTATGSKDRDLIEVAVSDTGCGIPEENLKNIFEPFFTTKEEGKGVGLGLSVVYGIIARHNGSIDVESSPGKGTTFKVKLHVDQGNAVPTP